jgi:hypothetical protein
MFQIDLVLKVSMICLKLTFQVHMTIGVNPAHALGANLAPDTVVQYALMQP